MGDRKVARTSEEVERLFIEGVWNTASSGQTSITSELEALVQLSKNHLQGGSIEKLLIFGSASRTNSTSGTSIFLSLGEFLERGGIQPIFCIVQESHMDIKNAARNRDLPENAQTWLKNKQRLSQFGTAILPWLVEVEQKDTIDMSQHHSFMRTCLQRNWQVVLVE